MSSDRSRAKKYAWDHFAKYIKLRDALKQTGTTEWAYCITCGKPTPVKNNDAGHFVPSRVDPILYDERNVHFQCHVCNTGKKDVWPEYYEKMLEMYGQEVIDELLQKKHSPFQYSTPEHREIGKKYQKKVKELLNGS